MSTAPFTMEIKASHLTLLNREVKGGRTVITWEAKGKGGRLYEIKVTYNKQALVGDVKGCEALHNQQKLERRIAEAVWPHFHDYVGHTIRASIDAKTPNRLQFSLYKGKVRVADDLLPASYRALTAEIQRIFTAVQTDGFAALDDWERVETKGH